MSNEDRRRYPVRPIVGVGAVILCASAGGPSVPQASAGPASATDGGRHTREDIVLIRRKFAPLAGEWSLPGGTLEVGETLESGLAREIVEETGLLVAVGPVVEVFDRIVLDDDRRVEYHFVIVDYLCRVRGGQLRAGSDVSDVAVVDPARIGEYGLTTKAHAVIERALEMARLEQDAPRQRG